MSYLLPEQSVAWDRKHPEEEQEEKNEKKKKKKKID